IPPQPGFFSQVLQRVQIPVLVYEQHKLIFWSDYTLPLDLDPRVLRRELQVVENRFGKYLVVRHPPLPTYTLLPVIPLETRYEISNAYLRSGHNPDIFEDHAASIQVEPSHNAIPIFDEQGRHLFSIKVVEEGHWLHAGTFTFALYGLALLAWLLFLRGFY